MIHLENITVSLPGDDTTRVCALSDVTLSIGRGEWLAITGANGAGKSTLLKTLAGLIAPDSGRIDYEGTAPAVALLLQEPDNQFVTSSVRNELTLSAAPTDGVQRITAALQRFELTDFVDRNPHQLSGGEKQRLAFATVWLAGADVVLLDEPLAYLDTEQAARCVEFVAELNNDGATVIWAAPTTRLPDGATRVVRLEAGHVISDAPPAEFAAAPVAARQLSERVAAPLHDTRVVVALNDVSFAYDEALVVEHLTAVAREFESVALVGRNGSGKSTVLSLMSGIYQPLDGQVGRLYRRASEGGRQNVFVLFQNPERLFFADSVYDEVASGLKGLGLTGPVVEQRVVAALDASGLPAQKFSARSPFRLSHGEMRRLAFALTRALAPRFILLDEPTSALDSEGLVVLCDLISDSVRDGGAVVVASHDARGELTHRTIDLS